MNKKLDTIQVNKKLTDLLSKDESLCLVFGKTNIILESYHGQDCCEHVYADFSVLKDFDNKSIINKKIKDIVIKATSKMGFVLVFNLESGKSEKVFIPCYNIQNGYYSDQLDLIIMDKGIKKVIDITGYTKNE